MVSGYQVKDIDQPQQGFSGLQASKGADTVTVQHYNSNFPAKTLYYEC